MIDCQEIVERYVATLTEGFRCLPSGARLRVITPYTYPDNDLIEIYVEELQNANVRVTDLGETFRHLHSQGFDVASLPKRTFLAETIASRVEVELSNARLSKVGPLARVGDLIFDVLVAARGVADLIYTSKTYEPQTFFEEVREFLEDNHFNVELRVRVVGSSGKGYGVDFRVLTGREAYLHTLSPRYVQGVKGKVDATFRMWSDFNADMAKVSLLNDVDFGWKEPDVIILGRVSRVAYWSRKEEVVGYLRSNMVWER